MQALNSEREAVWDLHHQACLDKEVFAGLAHLVYVRYMGALLLGIVIDLVKAWIAWVLARVKPELLLIIKDSRKVEEVSNLLTKRLDLFKNLRSFESVKNYATRHLPTLRVVENTVGPDPSDKAYGVMLVEWIVALMKSPDPTVRRHIIETSTLWKSGAMLKDVDIISEWWHGTPPTPTLCPPPRCVTHDLHAHSPPSSTMCDS